MCHRVLALLDDEVEGKYSIRSPFWYTSIDIIFQYFDTLVVEHFTAELLQAFPPGKPSGRDNQGDMMRVQPLRLFHKEMIQRLCACAITVVILLIRRISNHDV